MTAKELLLVAHILTGDAKNLVNHHILTEKIGWWPGELANIKEVMPDPAAPEIVFTVENSHGEIGVFADETVILMP